MIQSSHHSHSNSKQSEWCKKCCEQLSNHLYTLECDIDWYICWLWTDKKLQIYVKSDNICLKSRSEDSYCWNILSLKRHLFCKELSKLCICKYLKKHLFCKQLSKHCTHKYKNITDSIDVTLEAVSIEKYNKVTAENATEKLSTSE